MRGALATAVSPEPRARGLNTRRRRTVPMRVWNPDSAGQRDTAIHPAKRVSGSLARHRENGRDDRRDEGSEQTGLLCSQPSDRRAHSSSARPWSPRRRLVILSGSPWSASAVTVPKGNAVRVSRGAGSPLHAPSGSVRRVPLYCRVKETIIQEWGAWFLSNGFSVRAPSPWIAGGHVLGRSRPSLRRAFSSSP